MLVIAVIAFIDFAAHFESNLHILSINTLTFEHFGSLLWKVN